VGSRVASPVWQGIVHEDTYEFHGRTAALTQIYCRAIKNRCTWIITKFIAGTEYMNIHGQSIGKSAHPDNSIFTVKPVWRGRVHEYSHETQKKIGAAG